MVQLLIKAVSSAVDEKIPKDSRKFDRGAPPPSNKRTIIQKDPDRGFFKVRCRFSATCRIRIVLSRVLQFCIIKVSTLSATPIS